jgi:uncharacterized membrane protein
MSTNPYQGQTPDQSNQYGGYTGYTPPAQNDTAGSQQDGNASSGQDDYQYGQYTYGQGGQQQQQQQQEYQYGAYQPPQSALRGRSGATGTSGADDTAVLGMNGRTAAAASYILMFLSGFVIFFLERKNRFVRFNAAQSVLLFGSLAIALAVLQLLTVIPLIGLIFGLIVTVLRVLTIGLWIVLTVLAYRGKKVKLPFFGDYAESLVTRFTK